MDKKTGGARKGAGRPKLKKSIKREPITIFFTGATIKSNGGKKKFRNAILESYEPPLTNPK